MENTKLFGKRSYRISLDRKILQELARESKADLKDPVFETLDYFAQKFTKNKNLQKEIASVLSYFVLRHWDHPGRVLGKMEEEFNYIVVILGHRHLAPEKAVEFAVLIFRVLMLMRMHKFMLAHKLDAHLKKELRKKGIMPMIHYLPELEFYEEFIPAKGVFWARK